MTFTLVNPYPRPEHLCEVVWANGRRGAYSSVAFKTMTGMSQRDFITMMASLPSGVNTWERSKAGTYTLPAMKGAPEIWKEWLAKYAPDRRPPLGGSSGGCAPSASGPGLPGLSGAWNASRSLSRQDPGFWPFALGEATREGTHRIGASDFMSNLLGTGVTGALLGDAAVTALKHMYMTDSGRFALRMASSDAFRFAAGPGGTVIVSAALLLVPAKVVFDANVEGAAAHNAIQQQLCGANPFYAEEYAKVEASYPFWPSLLNPFAPSPSGKRVLARDRADRRMQMQNSPLPRPGSSIFGPTAAGDFRGTAGYERQMERQRDWLREATWEFSGPVKMYEYPPLP